MGRLNSFKDSMDKDIFGMTKQEAHEQGICINCGKPALPRCYSDAGRREYQISGFCECCFDELCGVEDEDE